MSFKVELDNFQGPFDLLLELLNKRKLEITELSIGSITNDYLEYISKMNTSLEELSAFLVVATKLTLDKSLAILLLDSEDEDIDIEYSLNRYASVKTDAKKIAKLLKKPSIASLRKFSIKAPNKEIDSSLLLECFIKAKKSANNKLGNMPIKVRNNQIEEIKNRFINKLKSMKQFDYNSALNDSKNKKEVIVGLLTLLDLIKKGSIGIEPNGFRISGGVL